MFLAFVMSSKSFPTLPIIVSTFPLSWQGHVELGGGQFHHALGVGVNVSKICWFLVTVLMPMSMGLEYVIPSGMSMSHSVYIRAVVTSFRLRVLFFSSNRIVTRKPSMRPVSWVVFSYMGTCVKCKCLMVTVISYLDEYKASVVFGNVRWIEQNSWTPVMGVPIGGELFIHAYVR